jgi:predicted transcriptional regulator
MNYESFLGEKRWEILEMIAGSPSSPIEISEKLGTTVSYVSQQLKLLEVSGFLKKEKTGLAEKGKPRNIYSINTEFFSYTLLDRHRAIKKQIDLDDHKKIILNIWSLESSKNNSFEKFVLGLDSSLKDINGLFLKRGTKEKLIVFSGKKEIDKKVGQALKSASLEIDFEVIEEFDPLYFSDKYFNLFYREDNR